MTGGPWELYQNPAQESGPWEQFQQAAPVDAQQVAQPASASAQNGGVMGVLTQGARALRMGLPFGDRVVAAEKTYLPEMLGGNGQDYAANLANERGADQTMAQAHPFLTGTGQAIGGLALPVGAAGAASRVASLGERALAGATAGAGLGAVQGVSDAPDWTNGSQTMLSAGRGAILGGGIGAALPLMAKGVGAAYGGIADKLAGGADGISSGAAAHLLPALEADGLSAVQEQTGRLGDQAMLADMGPALLGKAQGASLNSDEARTIMANALMQRQQGTNARIGADVDAALGPTRDPQLVTNDILAQRTAQDQQNYGQVFQGAPKVNVSDLLAALDQHIADSEGMEKKALTNLKSSLMVPGPDASQSALAAAPTLPDRMSAADYRNYLADQIARQPAAAANPGVVPQDRALNLHKIKGELDNVINYDAPGLGVPSGAVTRQQGALKQMRGTLNSTLEAQVPGYADANAASAQLARQADAVKLGTSLLDSGKTAMAPDRLAQEWAGMTDGERAAARAGTRGEIDRILDTRANDLVAGKNVVKGEGDWNRARLATVFGEEPTNQVIGAVDREGRFANTYNKVVENSQTAQRQAAARTMKPEPSSETPLFNPNMTLSGLGATVAKKAVGGMLGSMRADPTKSFGEVARVLSAQGAERDSHLNALIQALENRGRNAASGTIIGDRAALAAAILANGAQRDLSRSR